MVTSSDSIEENKVFPPRGNFGGHALVSPFEPDAASMDSDEPLFGMPPEALYLWGTLRDEEGDLHTIMRRIPHTQPATTRRTLVVQTTMGGASALKMHPCGRSAAPHTNFVRELVGDNAVEWRSTPDAEGAPFRVQWRPDGCTWIEEGTFELEGKMIRPGMQWYVPGPNASLAYIATIFELEGTIFGRKCRGLIGFDQIYMYEGGEVYKTKDPLIEEGLEMLWYTWATRYKDGSVDAGHFMLGNDKFGFAILTDENENIRITYDTDGEITYDEDGYWQTGARFSMAGEEFEFLPDPRGRMPDLGNIPNPQVDGRWRRVGDTREPDVWFAWGEAVPSHGGKQQNRYSY
ncbi:hypothetical protein ACIHDR_13150 [Nocardia sp. NPDC052278]|uniref:hypothetical protein n=1 Tax=unclassified Nocardia TaxID=2637762 RepID=UPI0036BC29B2